MKEKKYLDNQRSIDKELLAPVDDGTSIKEMSKSSDKALVEDDNKESHVKEGVLGIVQASQQSSGGTLADVLQSLSGNHKTVEDVPTVARLLGEVVSDFLAGLSKNGEPPAMQEARNVMAKIAKHVEQSKLEDVEGGGELKLLLGMLAEKVESPNPSNESDDTVTWI